jgi:hypothetical protein
MERLLRSLRCRCSTAIWDVWGTTHACGGRQWGTQGSGPGVKNYTGVWIPRVLYTYPNTPCLEMEHPLRTTLPTSSLALRYDPGHCILAKCACRELQRQGKDNDVVGWPKRNATCTPW